MLSIPVMNKYESKEVCRNDIFLAGAVNPEKD